MLAGIRGAANSWLGKIVLIVMFSFLIFSFAIWGIGDIFRGYGTNTVAKIGNTEIGVETYRRAYQQRFYDLQQRSRGLTGEQARQFGLDRQVLNQMLGEAALNETGRRLGLGLSDEDVARFLASQAVFKGADGQFSRAAFDNVIREAGLSETAFIQQQKQSMLRQQLGDALTGGFAAPAVVLDMIQRYQTEERSIQYVTVPGAIASTLEAPEDSVLKAYHDQRKAMFRAPEFRKVHFLTVSPAEFAADIAISDQELQAAYERGLVSGQYGTAEKRRIQQITFPDMPSAMAASERIKAGASFQSIADERQLKPADLDLGQKAKSEISDSAVAAAAFSAELNGVTSPVQGQFGVVLLRVHEITAGTAQPFESVKAALMTQLSGQRLASDRGIRRKIDDVHDRIEELRSAGKTLDDIAKETKRALMIVEAMTAQGTGKDGMVVANIPDTAETVKAVFLSDRGVDNEAIRTRDSGYTWFEVVAIEPARERSFDEVKAEILEGWRRDEAGRLTNERAASFLKRIEAGEALEAVATELGASVEQAEGFSRNGNTQISASVAASAFALSAGGVAIAAPNRGSDSGRGADRMIMKLLSSTVPKVDPASPESKTLKTQLDSTISEEILSQYVNQLQNALGVTVNDRAVAQAAGAAQQR
jgi:peptidyl-prolyl cis-trans isomerase D